MQLTNPYAGRQASNLAECAQNFQLRADAYRQAIASLEIAANKLRATPTISPITGSFDPRAVNSQKEKLDKIAIQIEDYQRLIKRATEHLQLITLAGSATKEDSSASQTKVCNISTPYLVK